MLLGLLTTVRAQKDSITLATSALEGRIIDPIPGYVKPFSHLDLSMTTGSTGLGFDASMPINKIFSVRAGYAFMPHFIHVMHFGVDVGDDPTLSQQRFEKLSGILESLTGNKVDNVVAVDGQPTYWNWKLMVDVKPFRNKHWHLTAGVYLGSHEVAKAVNSIEDMPSLMGVSIYNNLYYKVKNKEPFVIGEYPPFTLTPEVAPGEEQSLSNLLAEKLLGYGRMSIYMGDYKHDILYEEDVVCTAEGGEIIDGEFYMPGDVIHAKGDVMYPAGSPYRVVPDENSMVKAWAYANRVKPYIGFGYGGRLLKKDDSWQVSFDCGAMFWGGVPKVITHDGTDLVNDVENVPGLVGDYVDIAKHFKIFPVLNLRITKRLF